MVCAASQSCGKSILDLLLLKNVPLDNYNLMNPIAVTLGIVNNNKNSLFLAAAMSREKQLDTRCHSLIISAVQPQNDPAKHIKRPEKKHLAL